MLGLLIGTAGAFALMAAARRRHFAHHCAAHRAWHGGWHGGGWHDEGGPGPGFESGPGFGFGRGRHGRRGWRRGFGFRPGRAWLYWLFEHLDASPAQEKLIRQEADQLFEKARAFRTELFDSRATLAEAMRGEVFDSGTVADRLAGHDVALHALRLEAVAALGRIHESLDERQRERLADLLSTGRRPGPGPDGGPYR
jgi:uncharacterized membrane protein